MIDGLGHVIYSGVLKENTGEMEFIISPGIYYLKLQSEKESIIIPIIIQ
jgi:hypothetical protein